MSAHEILWIVRATGDVWMGVNFVGLVLCAMVYRGGGTREGTVKRPLLAMAGPPLWAAQIVCWLWLLRPMISTAMAGT